MGKAWFDKWLRMDSIVYEEQIDIEERHRSIAHGFTTNTIDWRGIGDVSRSIGCGALAVERNNKYVVPESP